MSRYQEIDLQKIKTYSVRSRSSKVTEQFSASPPYKGMSVSTFIKSLPKTLKAKELLSIAEGIAKAREKQKPIIAMLGGHVIKTGCSPIIADLASKGYITHIAANGSVAIHDTELAIYGHTSEEVDTQIENGSFGMARETASWINSAAKEAQKDSLGFGESLGKYINREHFTYKKNSLIAFCYDLKIPFTLHVAIGTDIVHQHPNADGAAIGEASYRDFRILAASVKNLGQGGLVMNLGSAVIMPEVFLKALSVVRNLGHPVKDFTAANFDMIQHYRPRVNVLKRPVQNGGQSYSITGHHEIMLPLLASAIYELDKNNPGS